MIDYTPKAYRKRLSLLCAPLFALALAGCSALGGNGPSSQSIRQSANTPYASSQVKIVQLDPAILARLNQLKVQTAFSEVLGRGGQKRANFGPGDAVNIAIYEAPPALLFGPFVQMGTNTTTAATPAAAANLPPVVIDRGGYISVPFVGKVRAEGRNASEIAADIQKRLQKKANSPQVLVSESRNTSRNVTVIGETAQNLRVPLTDHGERLLDVLASSGTLKQPIDKTTIQVSRGSLVAKMPLSAIIADPGQNVPMLPGDVVTALFKPYSFTALGSVKDSQEVDFEATGINLAQALGRVGGLDQTSANVRGLFVFRFEEAALLPPEAAAQLPHDKNGRVPVIYRLDLSKGVSLLLAQQFAMRDKDVLYVSRAPAVDIQNFTTVASQLVYTLVNVSNGLQQ